MILKLRHRILILVLFFCNVSSYAAIGEVTNDYTDFYQSWEYPSLLEDFSGGGGGGMTVDISDNILTVTLNAGFSLNKLKSGSVAFLTTSPNLPNMALGFLNLKNGTTTYTNSVKVSIISNHIYFEHTAGNNLQLYGNVNSTFSVDLLSGSVIYTDYNQTWNYPELLANFTGGGGGGLTVDITSNILTLTFNAGFSLNKLKDGNVVELMTSPNLPDIELGFLNLKNGTTTYNNSVKVSLVSNYVFFEHVAGHNLQLYSHVQNTFQIDLSEPIDRGLPPSRLSEDQNYVYTITAQDPTTDVSTLTEDRKIESVTYFDGLGRPMQHVGIRQAGGKSYQDIVTHINYDEYGRQDKEFKPYLPSSGETGSFRSGAETATLDYYLSSNYASELSATVPNPFSEKNFEASPLNRVLEQGAPGEDWAVNKGGDSDHTVKFEYQTNSTGEVRLYVVSLSSNFEPDLVLSDHYNAGELFKKVTKDENWQPGQAYPKAHTSEEFKDKQGRVVLKRTYGASDINMDGDTADSGEANAPHDTYYVYDDYGNLTYVLPPKSEPSSAKPDRIELAELCYQYKYDHRNRLVEKKIPGKGWEYIVYNKLDQPVLTQNEVQRNKNPKEWLFTKYDAFGRIIITGIHTYGTTTAISQATMQNLVNNYKAWEEKTTTATNNYYTNLSYPTSNLEVLTLNYYDNYTFDTTTQGLVIASGTNIFGNLVSHNVKGLSTGSKVKVLDQSPVKWITTVNHYDKKGRVLYTGSYNEFLVTTDKVKMELDFAGIVKKTESYHKRGTNAAITTIENFTYDHVNRLTEHTQTIGTKTELIAENIYGKTGELITKKVGNTPGAPLQTVDYTYNVRGWLKQINNPGTLDSDLFAFKLNYNTTEMGVIGTQPLYNGNISETLWRTANTENSYSQRKRGYAYQYDHLNRITAGHFRRANSTGSLFNEQLNDYNVLGITYDKNGNIGRLNRRGVVNSTNAIGDMDKLNYIYSPNTNKLVAVHELTGGNGSYGFVNGSTAATEYSYDPNGNLTSDLNKGIGTSTIPGIKYNHLNLPTEVMFNNSTSQVIKYTYDATGVKLRKEIPGKITDYAGNFVYEGGTLKFFNHPEGYVSYDGGQFNYVYNFKDHLGNIRLSYTDGNGNGSIDPSTEIVQEKNYYPFGLTHRGYNTNGSPYGNDAAKRYGFGGKELQSENISGNILDWYDFSARNYDPALGRWMNLDPLAEQMRRHSPYNYAFDNPIYFVDPDGMAPLDWYLNNDTGDYEFFDGSQDREGYTNIGASTDLVVGTEDSYSLNVDGTFEHKESGKKYDKGESLEIGESTEISSHLNTKESIIHFTSELVAPFLEVPQDIGFAIVNQVNISINEGIHEGKANNPDNVIFPNTYQFKNWSFEEGQSTQSTGRPTFSQGQEKINNALSVALTPFTLAKNVLLNVGAKATIKKAVKAGLKEME